MKYPSLCVLSYVSTLKAFASNSELDIPAFCAFLMKYIYIVKASECKYAEYQAKLCAFKRKTSLSHPLLSTVKLLKL